MNHKNSHSAPTANTATTEAIQALANIYLASAERMAELNLSTIRDAVEDSLSTTRQHSNATAESGFNLTQATALQPMIDKSMAYSRSAYEILAETQQEVLKTLITQLGVFGGSFRIPTDWNASLEMFNRGVRQFTTVANQNASATSDAVRKSAESLMKASKAA